MHEDNAFDEEELYSEDGDFLPDYWPEESDTDEFDDEDVDEDDDEFESFDDQDSDESYWTDERLIECFGMTLDEENHWIDPADRITGEEYETL